MGGLCNKIVKIFIKKNVSIKRSLKENLADVGMAQCMNALADKAHKQEKAMHTVICSP